MTLNNYKIIDDGIWISRKKLVRMSKTYFDAAYSDIESWKSNVDKFRHAYYLGKCDLCNDIIKLFDNETTEDSTPSGND